MLNPLVLTKIGMLVQDVQDEIESISMACLH